MAVTVRQNLFAGVNPYLQSLLQAPGTVSQWRSFHGQFIVNLTNHLNILLPQNDVAVNQVSLQLWGENDGTKWDTEDTPDGVLIYHDGWDGHPVLRIEHLLPSNKRGGEHEKNYLKRRSRALKEDIPLLEIDFLHESESPILGLPRYPQDKNSFPFYLALSDPRNGQVKIYGFGINMPNPAIHLPLADEKVIPVNFDTVYQFTYETGRWGEDIDYEMLPVRIEKYHPDDRKRIEARRDEILKQHP